MAESVRRFAIIEHYNTVLGGRLCKRFCGSSPCLLGKHDCLWNSQKTCYKTFPRPAAPDCTLCHIYQIIWEFGQAMTDSLVINVSSQIQPSDAFHA